MKQTDIKRIELTFVNVYLIKVSEEFILFDTGLSMYWDTLENTLKKEGCLPDKIKLVIITHGDFDHTGNGAKLQDKYQCKIAIHEADAPMAEEGVRQKRKVKSIRTKLLMDVRRLLRHKFTFDKFTPDLFLTDGQDLNEYGLDAKIIHIPGHTKGSIGILATDGSFFAGDIFTNRKKPDTATYIENAAELQSSYIKLKNLPIKTVYPGHGKPFDFKEILYKLLSQ